MAHPDRVWYAAYGSNLHADRFAYYLRGGPLPGTPRTYPGCRDSAPPQDIRPLTLPGCVYFAWESPVWTGGIAFYADRPPTGWPRGTAARGYLLTAQQFSDLRTQEMYRVPGEAPDLDLRDTLRHGRSVLGPGRYDTLIHVGDIDGAPVLTFTSSWDPATVDLRAPSARYLTVLATGLAESHHWTPEQIVDYLGKCPGVHGNWSRVDLRALVGDRY
ncbi:histone deacetylase [Nocardia terpenica]|uniref:Histone deacetylase n=1 Tax=Nocardia terpenica TaxID=455432 RepID=A0A291RLR0_9NOCA|nr:histone deacetylase [Nocardia terpenica]ATL68238.1 histone deacetylase [Nocardia terpenica]